MEIEEIKQAISDLYDRSNECSNLLNVPHSNYKHIAGSISKSVTDGLKDLMEKLNECQIAKNINTVPINQLV